MALIEKEPLLQAWCSDCPQVGHCQKTCEDYELIDNAPEVETASHWISCDDQLPSEKQNVLIFVKTKLCSFVEVGFLDNGVFSSSWDFEEIGVNVSHWMPLPEWPEIKKEEQNND